MEGNVVSAEVSSSHRSLMAKLPAQSAVQYKNYTCYTEWKETHTEETFEVKQLKLSVPQKTRLYNTHTLFLSKL